MRPIYSGSQTRGFGCCDGCGDDVFVGSSAVSPLLWSWSITEFQPDIPNGGRANSIAIDPTNDDNQWVATESGGAPFSTPCAGAASQSPSETDQVPGRH
jgi:hypothetical protein